MICRKWYLMLIGLLAHEVHAATNWKVVDGHLGTRWTAGVSPSNVLPEHPRPQMKRDTWTHLNGLWEYAVVEQRAGEQTASPSPPAEWDGQILVPFCIESSMSGVMRALEPDQTLWYRRTFEVPSAWADMRILLHFGAVDWSCQVWVNDRHVGGHTGGYDPFVLDITDELNMDKGQTVRVHVTDPTDAGYQPRGKQVRKPGGIWYTSVSGIWQTVWLEAVPSTHVKSLRITPDVDAEQVLIAPVIRVGADSMTLRVRVEKDDALIQESSLSADDLVEGGTWSPQLKLTMPGAKLWSPDHPHLYDLRISLEQSGRSVDTVDSYFGMRKIDVRKDAAGINLLFLNNEPLFQYGTLDQGWWPDGLYTAPADEALRHDVEITRQLGFNMARKHVKIEPARWYYWCDVIGLLVWQDMPNGDRGIGGDEPDIQRSPESAEAFESELEAMVNSLYNHPSIVAWVPYNEGWGQWDTERICGLVKEWDPTRLVNHASGWTDRGVGDVNDVHRYPGPGMPRLEDGRAAVLGEFGGLGLPVPGHTWQDQENWGYQSYETPGALTDAYVELLRQLRILVGRGLAAAVYTQTSDVEVEVNGLMTYDRARIKIDAGRARDAARKLYLPPPVEVPVVASSRLEAQTWQYTFSEPGEGWEGTDFNDAGWESGPGGFGTEITPGAVIRTEWSSSEIWLRREFEIQAVPEDLQWFIHHDEDVEVYLNGQLVLSLAGFTTDYITKPVDKAARLTFRSTSNTLAVHCRQTAGGQYIDVGLVQIVSE